MNNNSDQQQESLRERVFALLLALMLIALSLVWVFDVENSIRYGVSLTIALLVISSLAQQLYHKRNLRQLRETQLKEFHDKNKNSD